MTHAQNNVLPSGLQSQGSFHQMRNQGYPFWAILWRMTRATLLGYMSSLFSQSMNASHRFNVRKHLLKVTTWCS